jgi:aryl sulfotransferase
MSAGVWWLASYPKSGNTWLRALLLTLVSGKPADINRLSSLGGFAGSRSQFDNVLGIDGAVLSPDQEANLRPRVFEFMATGAERALYCKAHDAYHLTPAGEPLFPASATSGAVYVVRDPRAVAVSLAHYAGQPIDEAIAHMDNPEALSGGSTTRLSEHLRQRLLRWSDHVETWLGAPFPVHLVRYEDMQADPNAALGAVAAFLGLPGDQAAIAAAVEAATFSRLQAQERESGFIEKPRRAAAFFREGRVDGWRQALSPEQAARIVAAHGAVMRRLGYDETREALAARQSSCLSIG